MEFEKIIANNQPPMKSETSKVTFDCPVGIVARFNVEVKECGVDRTGVLVDTFLALVQALEAKNQDVDQIPK